MSPAAFDGAARGAGGRFWLRALSLAVIAAGAAGAAVACSNVARGDGLDAAELPPNVRSDYAVFAHDCSKCHSLARPLDVGAVDDDFWRDYVERMRRQPGSGITPRDEAPILRFLHYYSVARRRPRDAGAADHD